jgi:hypothetical protein
MRVYTSFLSLIAFLFIFSSSALAGSNVMKISPITADPGDVILVELEIINEDPFIAFDVSIPLPEGFTYVAGSFQLNPDRRNGHVSSASVTSGGTLKILSYSMQNAAYHGNEGVIASFQLTTSLIPGPYELLLQSPTMASSSFPYSNILTGVVNGQVTITGEVPEQFTLTVAVEGNGAVTVNGDTYTAPVTVYAGTTLNLAAQPSAGWEFTEWSGDISSYNQTVQITMDGDKQLTALFAEISDIRYTLTVNLTGNGVVTANNQIYTAPLTVNENTTLELEAIPDPGWQFDQWEGDASGSEAGIQLLMDEDKSVTAVFSLIPTGENSMRINNASGETGQVLELELVIDNQDPFVAFSAEVIIPEGFTYVENSATLNDERSSDHILSETLLPGNILQLMSTSASRTVFDNTEGPVVFFSVTASDEAGTYTITISDGEITSLADINILTAREEGTITLTEPIPTYTITTTAGENGSIAPSGIVEAEEGSSRVFTLTPDEGYHVGHINIDAEPIDLATDENWDAEQHTYTFNNIVQNHTIEAGFAINTYTITATTSGNGSIDPEGEVVAEHGSTQVFTLTPDEGHFIDHIMVDAEPVNMATDENWDPENNTYTFNNIVQNHTIEAGFAIHTYTITATANDNGSIEPAGEVIVEHGSTQAFTITPDEGFHLLQLMVDDAAINLDTDESWDAENNSYTFNNIVQNHTIEASFAINTYTITASAGENGSIEPSGEIAVEHGQEQAFIITPNETYHVAFIRIDGEAIDLQTDNQWNAENRRYTFLNISQSHSIEAGFAIDTYTITATAGNNGSINPSGEIAVEHGGTQAFTATPNNGYRLSFIKVDGSNINLGSEAGWDATNSRYTFSNVTQDHSIEAGFEVDDTSLDEPGLPKLHIYPNPASGHFIVEANMIILQLNIFDLSGRQLHKSEPGNAAIQVDISSLPVGHYLISIETAEGRATKRLQVIKN